MNSNIAPYDQSMPSQTDYYYQQWRQLKEIGREVFERRQKKVRLGHPIICNLARLLSLYEPINGDAYRCLQQRVKENDCVDARSIYDWISTEKDALKAEREIDNKRKC